MYQKLHIIFILTILYWLPYTFCQNSGKNCVSCSVVSMEELLQVERKAVISLENYIKKLENKIDLVRSGLEVLLDGNQKFKDDEVYTPNPLIVFSLIHRLNFDWYDWDMFLEKQIGIAEIQKLQLLLSDMPTNRDFSEAVHSLNRLQNVHYITANDMTKGVLRGRQYDSKLSAFDAFAIARNMFNRSQFREANEWVEEALRLHEENALNDLLESNLQDLYAFFGETELILGNSAGALTAMNEALSFDPFDTKLNRQNNEMEGKSYGHLEIINKNGEGINKKRDYFSEKTCRNGFPPQLNNLHCHLFDKTNAFLKLAPFKMEELSLDPYVMKFYGIISEKENDHLKELSRQRFLFRPLVITDYSEIDDSRTSKVAWIPDNITNIVIKINQRISDMTGFDLREAENLQVMNYGIAGQYLYHRDFLNYTLSTDPSKLEQMIPGDRIATVLIYMNDVIDGGETIFPRMKIVAKPEMGTALVWYNLDDKGDPDINVGHIACPVIVGSKWAVTKWIREKDQFRARPCLPVKNMEK